jgi:two-component system cell cycle sensor histidine kinase/response regulator CckA
MATKANKAQKSIEQTNAKHRHDSQEVSLQGLASQFDATSLGLCSLSDSFKDYVGTPPAPSGKPSPWQANEKLAESVRASLSAVSYHDEQGEWLIAAVMVPERDEPLAAWAHRTGKGWTEHDAWQWALAGQALARWHFAGAIKSATVAAQQNRLEMTAVIVRRLVHEFGNLLTGIMGFTELAQARVAPEDPLATYLTEVMQSAHHGADWIRRLHRFCQRNTAFIWPTHLAGLLLANETRSQSLGILQQWVIDVPADLPLLQIDAGSLQAIVQELQNNAREATNDKGTLSVQARVRNMTAADCQNTLGALRPGECVEITFVDDGPGFSAEARAKLFRDVFFSSKPRHRGAGLLVVYGILQRFNGGLAVELDAKTTGATVRVYLPIANLPTETPLDNPAHLMLVHSDSVLLESMRSVLTADGVRVATANTAEAALLNFEDAKLPIQLVIAESNIAGESGFDLARKVLDEHPKVQFLFLNAQSFVHDYTEEETQGHFTVLRWPMDIAGFRRAVANALANPAS